MDADETDRLARLEREMSILRAEFARLREHVGPSANATHAADPPYARSTPAPPRPTPSATSFPAPARPRATPAPEPFLKVDDPPTRSLEEVLGRYGTIAVATLTVLVGVGIFLNWAIEHALLGPTARVGLGYVIAIAVAAVGVRLRLRGTREFGNVLLAMSLGVIHLVSWSAGPLLHVIPSWVALAIGFVTSAVLSEFALRHEEESLCAIGFGGAAIAPFVLSDSDGNKIALAVYGLVVISLAAAALRARPWIVARRVTIASILLYTLASGMGLSESSPPEWISSRLWVLFPLAALVALTPLAHSTHRLTLIRTAGSSLIIGATLRAVGYGPDVWAIGLTVAGAIITIGVLDLSRPAAVIGENQDTPIEVLEPFAAILDAFVLPLGLFLAAVMSTPNIVSYQSATLATLWTVGAIGMTHRTRGEPYADMYAITASLIALWIMPAAFLRQELPRVAGSAFLGILMMFLAARMSRQAFIVCALASLTMASAWALMTIDLLTPFQYAPFMTMETLGCALAVVGWLGVARVVAVEGFMPGLEAGRRDLLRRGLITGAAVTALWWGVGELQGAWNESASTSLLIVYYAATGTFMIWLGRKREVKALRLIGLGLALWSALKALGEAFDIPNVAVRIGVFFAVSAFLIAVGYWYRRTGDDDEPAAIPAS